MEFEAMKTRNMNTKTNQAQNDEDLDIYTSIIYGSGSRYHKKNYLFFARSVPREEGFFHEMGTGGDILIYVSGLKTGKEPAVIE